MPTTKLADLNILAISLVENHPGYAQVAPVVDEGLSGRYRLLLPAVAPLRARWIMTNRWGIPKAEADVALRAFLEQPRAHFVDADGDTLRRAFGLADELGHDVYDAFLIALAHQHGADTLLTADKGLRTPCQKAGLEYENPVPPAVLRRFASANVRSAEKAKARAE